jgi:hypothetical protein
MGKPLGKQLLDSLRWWREGKINADFRKSGFAEGSRMDVSECLQRKCFILPILTRLVPHPS